MPNVDDIRKSVAESRPLRAAVGASDLAVERVREALGDTAATQAKVEARVTRVQKSIGDAVTGFDRQAFRAKVSEVLDPKSLQNAAQHLPGVAVSRAFEVAGRAEARYESFAERGKEVLDRVRAQRATQDLLAQGKDTLGRTKAAVTTVRKVVDDKTVAAREAAGFGREAEAPAPDAPVAEAAADEVVSDEVVAAPGDGAVPDDTGAAPAAPSPEGQAPAAERPAPTRKATAKRAPARSTGKSSGGRTRKSPSSGPSRD